jgi:hypothetical protein
MGWFSEDMARWTQALQNRVARLQRLQALNAPALIIRNEAKLVAKAAAEIGGIAVGEPDAAKMLERWAAEWREAQAAEEEGGEP